VKIIIPPPLDAPPPPQSFFSDFSHLLKAQLRVAKNKIRHWPANLWVAYTATALGLGGILVYLGFLAYRAMLSVDPELGGGFLSMIFLASVAAQLFFGITSAFVALYMSEDLEILFVSPVSIRAVFAVKSLVIAAGNFLPVLMFAVLPGVFYGLLFNAPLYFYLILLLAVFGLWILGTAMAELLNLIVMRVVPPHRSREAIGAIGALVGIIIALFFQIPNLVIQTEGQIDFAALLAKQKGLLQAFSYFPWGWASRALLAGVSGEMSGALGWCLLLLAVAVFLFLISFTLVERGFRRGWVSVSQPPAKRRRKKQKPEAKAPVGKTAIFIPGKTEEKTARASAWHGMWAVAKKDLLYLRRDTREWFGYLTPLILMAFFVGQHILLRSGSSASTMVTVLIMYTLMFSGNMALQSFGREGEADWVLNSVPLAGAPVVCGKLLASVIPTLFLMEALLAGTAAATGLSASLTLMLAMGAVLLTLGASSIGLFYSATSARYNPDNPQRRIAPGSSFIMYLVNLLFLLLLAFGLLYLIPPAEIITIATHLPRLSPQGFLLKALHAFAVFVSRPFLWHKPFRILVGFIATGGIWSAFFFGFLAATIRVSKKGIRVEPLVSKKKKKSLLDR
jgi:ABC-2 type transport system permease protein